jgi:hypothetical protein
MLMTASTTLSKIGWHSSFQGYFTTVEGKIGTQEKARMVSHPGGILERRNLT